MRFRKPGLLTLTLAGQAIAFWPVWRWYAIRLVDPSSERWGIVALAAAIMIIAVQPGRARQGDLSKPVAVALAGLLGLYLLCCLYAPMLLAALPALFSVLLVLHYGRPFPPAVYGLTLISLPILPALDFYFGYPFRLITGEGAALLLRVLGHPVVSEGVLLRSGDALIMVDAPCGGLRMMWGGLLITLALGGLFRHALPRLASALLITLFVAVCANIVRAALLYFLETSPLVGHPWAHEGVGVILFLEMAVLLCWVCGRRAGEATP